MNKKDENLLWTLPSLGGPSSVCVYGSENCNSQYIYADHIGMHYSQIERDAAAHHANKKCGDVNTVEWWEEYLSQLLPNPVEIESIILERGLNGYTYRAIGFNFHNNIKERP